MATDKHHFIGINNVFLVSTFACVIVVPDRLHEPPSESAHRYTMCIIEFDIKIIILGKFSRVSRKLCAPNDAVCVCVSTTRASEQGRAKYRAKKSSDQIKTRETESVWQMKTQLQSLFVGLVSCTKNSSLALVPSAGFRR